MQMIDVGGGGGCRNPCSKPMLRYDVGVQSYMFAAAAVPPHYAELAGSPDPPRSKASAV